MVMNIVRDNGQPSPTGPMDAGQRLNVGGSERLHTEIGEGGVDVLHTHTHTQQQAQHLHQ